MTVIPLSVMPPPGAYYQPTGFPMTGYPYHFGPLVPPAAASQKLLTALPPLPAWQVEYRAPSLLSNEEPELPPTKKHIVHSSDDFACSKRIESEPLEKAVVKLPKMKPSSQHSPSPNIKEFLELKDDFSNDNDEPFLLKVPLPDGPLQIEKSALKGWLKAHYDYSEQVTYYYCTCPTNNRLLPTCDPSVTNQQLILMCDSQWAGPQVYLPELAKCIHSKRKAKFQCLPYCGVKKFLALSPMDGFALTQHICSCMDELVLYPKRPYWTLFPT